MALVSAAGQYLVTGKYPDESVYTARKVRTAMVFVRCKGGIRHHPTEYASPEDWYACNNVNMPQVL